MPAGYAHYIFGKKVFDQLPENEKRIIEKHPDAFYIGIHGPDILFYYNAIKSNDIIRLGNSIHDHPASEFFSKAKEILEKHQYDEYMLSYIYGFICHFALDHACHPHVYEMQKNLGLTHSEIESEFDRRFLVLEGKNPVSAVLTKHIHVSHNVARIIAPFFSLSEEDIYKSLKDMMFYLGMIRCPSKIKRSFVLTVMKIGKVYDEYKGLLISYHGNNNILPEIDQLLLLLNSTVDETVELISQFRDHELNEIYQYNFENLIVGGQK